MKSFTLGIRLALISMGTMTSIITAHAEDIVVCSSQSVGQNTTRDASVTPPPVVQNGLELSQQLMLQIQSAVQDRRALQYTIKSLQIAVGGAGAGAGMGGGLGMSMMGYGYVVQQLVCAVVELYYAPVAPRR